MISSESKKPPIPSVSIVIPVFNGLHWLQDSIPLFLSQEYRGEFDVLAIDSGSTDGSVEFLSRYDSIRVVQIPQNSFNHGRTRNLAIEHSKNEFFMFTVQDAKPRDAHWLSNMMMVAQKEQCEAVCGGQAVEPVIQNNPLEWFAPQVKSTYEVIIHESADFKNSDAQSQYSMCGWDNVNALYSRRILGDVKFPERLFGEDMAWAKSALTHGFRICYAKHNKIWHYHFHHPDFTRKRTLAVCFLKQDLFGILPNLPARFNVPRALFSLIFRKHITNPKQLWFWLRHNSIKIKTMRKGIFDFSAAVQNDRIALRALEQELGQKSPIATKH